jgi:hypothetical protein
MVDDASTKTSVDAKGRTQEPGERANELLIKKNLFSFENILNEHLLSFKKSRKTNKKSGEGEEKNGNKNLNEKSEPNSTRNGEISSHLLDSNIAHNDLAVELKKENRNLLLLNENLMQIVKIKHRNKASLFNLCLPNKPNEGKREEREEKCNEIVNVYLDQITSLSMPWSKRQSDENEAGAKELEQVDEQKLVEQKDQENADDSIHKEQCVESDRFQTNINEIESERVTSNKAKSGEDQVQEQLGEGGKAEEVAGKEEEQREQHADNFKLENNACQR